MRALAREGAPADKPISKPAPATWQQNGVTAAWLGHATVLLNFYGVTILTDPALFPRIGANTGIVTVGPKRLVAAPLKPSELPSIDLVLISHAHMDHLDPASLKALPGTPKAVTAQATTDCCRERESARQSVNWGGDPVAPHMGTFPCGLSMKHWGAALAI